MSTLCHQSFLFFYSLVRSFHEALGHWIHSLKVGSVYAVLAFYHSGPMAFLGITLPFFTPWRSKIRVCLCVIFLVGSLKGWFVWIGANAGFGAYALMCEGGLFWLFYRHAQTSFQKIAWGSIAGILGFFLMTHNFGGIYPVFSLPLTHIKPASTPYQLCFMPDGMVVSLFISYLCIFQRATWKQWKYSLYMGSAASLCLALVLILPAVWAKVVAFQPGVPFYFSLWSLKNVLWTSMSEEIFYRLFLQSFFLHITLRYQISKAFPIGASSLIFGCAHLPHHAYALMASVAGVFYGWVYQKTGRIESSIIAHAFFNVLHALLFTYPFYQAS